MKNKLWKQMQKDRWSKTTNSGAFDKKTHSEVSLIKVHGNSYGVIGVKYDTKPIGINNNSNALSKIKYNKSFLYKNKKNALNKVKKLKKEL